MKCDRADNGAGSAEVRAAGIRVTLATDLDEPAIRPELRGHLLSASITLDDAKPLFLEFQAGRRGFSSGTQDGTLGRSHIHRW
jgi:hypothetical protein